MVYNCNCRYIDIRGVWFKEGIGQFMMSTDKTYKALDDKGVKDDGDLFQHQAWMSGGTMAFKLALI